jgi:hypothetical protein
VDGVVQLAEDSVELVVHACNVLNATDIANVGVVEPKNTDLSIIFGIRCTFEVSILQDRAVAITGRLFSNLLDFA